MSASQKLADWHILLDHEASKQWCREYGIKGIYLNDIAAGVLIEVPKEWDEKHAAEQAAGGLRHLVQSLWQLDLVRPVIGVYWGKKTGQGNLNRLRQMQWDDELHRGDFALREAAGGDSAKELLYTLIADRMDALDKSARADKVGRDEVLTVFKQKQEGAEGGERRLFDALVEELERAERIDDADFARVLDKWSESETGGA